MESITKEDDDESLVKGVDNLKIINERPIPMGSQEFQKAILECDLSRGSSRGSSVESSDDEQFRQRSHTIDTTYGRHRAHSVSFASNLVSTKPIKHSSHEEMHPKGILRHHHEHLDFFKEETRPARRNTLDNTYRVNKKFFTRPEKSSGSDEKNSKGSDKKHSSSSETHVNSSEKEVYSSSGKSHHPNHFKNGSSPRRSSQIQGKSLSPRPHIEDDRVRSKSPNKVKLSQGVHS
ncbi:hypothetical protein FSP39_017520 [Pinctada imbricata]|uniref:Uncharacterized protein n=1 Tax=Pinctada imbricata TaxID=66713 RepID=A0AA89BQ28_PINIB|nr:hypothetical protein FSP39_017520 [Pinctada imbricata]